MLAIFLLGMGATHDHISGGIWPDAIIIPPCTDTRTMVTGLSPPITGNRGNKNNLTVRQ